MSGRKAKRVVPQRVAPLSLRGTRAFFNGQCTMDNVQWTIDNGGIFLRKMIEIAALLYYIYMIYI